MSREDARSAAEELAHDIETQYGLRCRWKGDTATMRGSGVDGSLTIGDDVISVKVSLGFLAAAFEQPLRRAINDYLDQYVS
jgi:putative polyhydroxyalkanoate system protein